MKQHDSKKQEEHYKLYLTGHSASAQCLYYTHSVTRKKTLSDSIWKATKMEPSVRSICSREGCHVSCIRTLLKKKHNWSSAEIDDSSLKSGLQPTAYRKRFCKMKYSVWYSLMFSDARVRLASIKNIFWKT